MRRLFTWTCLIINDGVAWVGLVSIVMVLLEKAGQRIEDYRTNGVDRGNLPLRWVIEWAHS
jgi:hypothetical protein